MIDKTDPSVAANIDALLKVLDPADNATGGGTASAAAGAMAAGLAGCAANVRINIPAIKDQAVVDELTRSVDALGEGAPQ